MSGGAATPRCSTAVSSKPAMKIAKEELTQTQFAQGTCRSLGSDRTQRSTAAGSENQRRRSSWRSRATARPRNSINDQRSLLHSLCQSEEATNCSGATAAQAEFRTDSGTWSRVGGLLLILIGVSGMVLLLGHIGLRLLMAAMLSLFYLLLAPGVVLAPALGRAGQSSISRMGRAPVRSRPVEARVRLSARRRSGGDGCPRSLERAGMVDAVVAVGRLLVGRVPQTQPTARWRVESLLGGRARTTDVDWSPDGPDRGAPAPSTTGRANCPPALRPGPRGEARHCDGRPAFSTASRG